MPQPANHHPKNKELRLHLASALYFMSRVAVAGFVFAVPAVYFIRGQVEMPVVLGGAALVTLLFAAYYLAASGLRCSACSNPVLMDNGTRKHPHAKRFPGLSHRARVAWDVLFSTNYLCMYCNTRCRCKKNWSQERTAPAAVAVPAVPAGAGSMAAAGGFPESVFSSVFGGAELDPREETGPVGRFPGVTDEELHPVREEFEPKVKERRATAPQSPVFPAPDARTAPVEVTSESPFPATPPKKESAAVPAAEPEAPRSPMPWEMPAPRRDPKPQTAPVAATEPVKLPTAPVPPSQEKPLFTNDTPAMNNFTQERTAGSAPTNPFLAAAAAQPPPSGPILPTRSRPQQPAAETGAAPAFPTAPAAPAAQADGPPPWTLPAMPARPAPAITAPVLPVIPDTAASLARRPGGQTAPVPPVAPSPFGATPPTAPVMPPAPVPSASAALPTNLLRDVVSVLEEGQRSISSAFQSIIQKLEAKLTAPEQAPAPAPAQAPRAEVPASAKPAPILPAMVPAPAPAPAPAQLMPEPVLPPPPALEPVKPAVPAPLPSEPAMEEAPAAPARRRFVRPNGASAQSLSDALNGAFAPAEPAATVPAPAPAHSAYANGHASAPSPLPPVESPFGFAPPQAVSAAPRQPAFNPGAFVAPGADSPFALADETLTQASAPHVPQPAPFTFLKPQGDHFAPKQNTAPVPAAAPAPAYDALEDTPLPWMQPVGGRR